MAQVRCPNCGGYKSYEEKKSGEDTPCLLVAGGIAAVLFGAVGVLGGTIMASSLFDQANQQPTMLAMGAFFVVVGVLLVTAGARKSGTTGRWVCAICGYNWTP